MAEPEHPKLCLTCARAKLAGKPNRACADCALINMDPLARTRANYARPSPLARFTFMNPSRPVFESEKPARRTGYGGDK